GPLSHVHPTDRLVGQSPATQALRAQIRHLSAFDTVGSAFVPTLLLQGETGTGKGLIARVIHDSGPRAQGPFVDINCAAIPETLLEVELFGFEAGAFTDAKRAKPGLLESASHGTLFLDEIDALPLPLQAKLLSAIEEKRVRRVGAVASRQVDVKLIAATPADLSLHVAEGRFQPDLYHRLAVVILDIPPLRERGEDILLLAQYFLVQYGEAHGLQAKRLSRDVVAWLRGYGWPGNVRELSHLMERVTLLCITADVTAATLERLCLPRLQLTLQPGCPTVRSDAGALDEPGRIRQALGQTGGNVVQAARLLGIKRGALRYRMRHYGIGRPSFHLSSPSSAFSHQGGRGLERHGEREGGQAECWEQKPVVVLAIDVAWPETMEHQVPRVEAWTMAMGWQQTIAEVVRGFGGLILQHSPALLTVIFGIPQTLEQMPQRAVQVALAIRCQVMEEGARDGKAPGPALRMGVHLGQVLVDVQASDPTTRILPLGETLSLPVRLLGQAAPGDILVAPRVWPLVEGWFELLPQKGPAGAGLSDGVSIYAVAGQRPRRSPLEVYGKRPLSRLVGRERELARLSQILVQVEQGQGQVVGIVGEPSVGKSRLCHELTQSQRTRGWLILESSPVAYGKGIPYLPIIDLLRAHFQLDVGDERETVIDKVVGKLHTLGNEIEAALPAFLALLDVPVEDAEWRALDPPGRRQRTLEAYKHLVLLESQSQPILLVVENLHWIDTETEALLDSLVDSLAAVPILLVSNYRPEYQPSWGGKTYYTQLRLDPLPPERADELLQDLLGMDPSLTPVKHHLIETTEGNPFFLEESVCTLVQTGVLVGGIGAYRLAHTMPRMQVPGTVQAVLAARIDRLPPENKRLLQTAAVVGHSVPLPLLRAVTERSKTDLYSGLADLQAAEFLYETRLIPEPEFTFKHALTHEVAYNSLVQEQRRMLHARIVETLEGNSGEQAVEQLAHHALRGEVWEKALAYSRQAGDKAMGRTAYREAVMCFEHALVALRHLPEAHNTLAQGIDLLCELQGALVAFGEFRRGFDYLTQAEVLADRLGDRQRLGQALALMTHSFWRESEYDRAIACGQRALAITAASGDDVHHAMVLGYLGTVYFSMGDYRRAIDLLREALTSFEGEVRHERFGIMMLPSVRVLTWLVDCLREVGDFGEGIACSEEALRIADATGHLGTKIITQRKLGDLLLRQGNLQRAIPVLEEALNQCHTAHVPLFVAGMTISLGMAYALAGRNAEAMPLLNQVHVQEETLTSLGGNSTVLRVGEAYLRVGRWHDAFQLAELAQRLSHGRKERGNLAWVLWLLGEIAMCR
ncbi:MAG TPA: sigma 54-interacting transcriptional regulator, partial [Candidatus Tectomicrobia bacterium]|nr:sigma 54-interacting transcriptional regulator [Candidatus Tectomicrobia bacterium]